jgi:hypothetical protein
MIKFKSKLMKKIFIAIISTLIVLFSWAGLTKAGYIENYFGIEMLCSELDSDVHQFTAPKNSAFPIAFKPVIYLYPETPSKVEVKLNYAGELIAHYPDYDYLLNGWRVFTYPDGKIINEADNKEYSYLFWEGKSTNPVNYDLSSGFVVKGSETKIFLQKLRPWWVNLRIPRW